MGKKLDKIQKSIWKDIVAYIVVMVWAGLVLEFINVEMPKYIEWIIMLLPPTMLIFSLFNKLKRIPYICKNCNSEIYIKFKQTFTFHAGAQRRIRCPHCGKVTWAELKDE